MKQVYIINGSGGVGKTTFALMTKEIIEQTTENNRTVTNFSSVDKVKEIASIIGWNGEKGEKDRKFLSELKKLTTEYNDMSFKSVSNKYDDFMLNENNSQILFLHIREPEEIARAAKAFNAKTLLIKSNRIEHITSNQADANVFNYDYDYIVNNDGTIEDLKEEVVKFIERLESEEV